MADIRIHRTNIEGQVAEGTAVDGNPVLIAGDDGTNVRNLEVDASGRATVQGTTVHDGPDAGRPHKIGAKAVSSLEAQTMVAANDRTDLYADLDGQLIVKPHAPYADLIRERVSDTAGTSTNLTTFGAGGAGVRNYVTQITIANAHASTFGYVDIRDGSAGSIIYTIPAPPESGAVVHFNPPLRQPTANTALAYDVSAAITTVYISFNGFQSKA